MSATASTKRKGPTPTSEAKKEDFSGGRPAAGATGGFTGANPTVRYTVERISPADGLLGVHHGSFSIEELGQTYGEGIYKVMRQDPTQKFVVEYIQKIGASYGRSRSPHQGDSVLWKIVPKAIVEESILNRLAETKKALESITQKMKNENINLSEVKGELDFLRATTKHIDDSLEQLIKQQQTAK